MSVNEEEIVNKIQILYNSNKQMFEKCTNIGKEDWAKDYKIKMETIIEVCESIGLDYKNW